MSRRNEQTAKHPDIELAREEKEIIEGQKNTLQTEIIGIANNKKELETNFEDAKNKLQEEFEIKKKTLDTEIEKLQNMCVTWRQEELRVRDAAQTAITQRDQLIQEEDEHHKYIKDIFHKKDILKAEHKNLIESKAELEKNIHIITKEISDLQKTKNVLTSSISTLDTKKKETEKELTHILSQISIEKNDLKKIQSEKIVISNESNNIGKKINEAKQIIETLNSNILDLQKKKSELEQAISKREGDINERMGNLSRLEIRVGEKMELLKEAKKEFTIEHLHRMGIKD